jgi:hypothetical protein
MKGFYKLGLLLRKVGSGLLYTLARIINSTPSQYNIIYCIVLLLATIIKTLPLSNFLYLRAGLSSVTPQNQLTSPLGSLLSHPLELWTFLLTSTIWVSTMTLSSSPFYSTHTTYTKKNLESRGALKLLTPYATNQPSTSHH